MSLAGPARGLLLGLCLVGAARAALPPRALGAPATGRPVRVVPLDGAPVEGPFAGLSAAGLRLEGREAPFPLDALREARFAPDGPLPPLPEGSVGLRVVLRGGEVLRGTLVAGSEDAVELRPPGLSAVKLPFDVVRRIEAEPADRNPCAEPSRERPPREGLDVAYARSGDAFPGTLAGADAQGLTLEHGGDRRSVRWTDLAVLQVDEPELPPAEGLVGEMETVGGSRLVATAMEGDASTIRVTTRSGVKVEVPRDAVAVLRWTGGRFVYASDLPYASEFTPYYKDDLLDPKWLERWYGARSDRTPSGCPLRVAGAAFRHGIAVHARSVVRIPLRKAFSRFETRFGIDDEALASSEGPRGDVTARILADGKEVWSSGGGVKGGETARVVGPLDVRGVDSLVLEVDFGAEQHQMDRADWADPLLVRAP